MVLDFGLALSHPTVKGGPDEGAGDCLSGAKKYTVGEADTSDPA